ncbi:hypothetical protein SOQ14_00625 [Erythrobacter sp. T5W1-R]|uniref:hypothetical protein n=1 Tax=Erythrobacter sp. T5W1-R TaxID=3101752 RepID=UPI002AFE1088|nr:hypothetical protein [Erythrobacter sp. T5W1-R]MEA1617416.1 hypothetical protein [Erythrobacter sp. T5W1-R]
MMSAAATPCEQQSRSRIVVSRDVWRRFLVSVEPATITHQPRSFRDHGAPRVFAEGLKGVEGWPICDRVETL